MDTSIRSCNFSAVSAIASISLFKTNNLFRYGKQIELLKRSHMIKHSKHTTFTQSITCKLSTLLRFTLSSSTSRSLTLLLIRVCVGIQRGFFVHLDVHHNRAAICAQAFVEHFVGLFLAYVRAVRYFACTINKE